MLAVATEVLRLPSAVDACIVEAGCFKGGSSAKLSLCAALTSRTLYLFDSFQGIPSNSEYQQYHDNQTIKFETGAYSGTEEEVRRNIAKLGNLGVCRFVKGWFSETMPSFAEPIGVAYVDVDLISSTRDCLVHLYKHVVPGGAFFSQDAHLSGVAALLRDGHFWLTELQVHPPSLERLASPQLVRIRKQRLLEEEIGV
jgi:O-methyltransferase